MTGIGRGVRLAAGEDNVLVRVRVPESMHNQMIDRIRQLNSAREPGSRPIDTSRYIRALISDDLGATTP